MRTVNDPFGGNDPLVDKMIGTAYDTVKTVALSISQVQHVSANMETVYNVDQNMDKVQAIAEALPTITSLADYIATLGPLGSSINVYIGDIPKNKITSISVLGFGLDGNLYFPSDTFTWTVVGTNVVIVLHAGGPEALANGKAKLHITFLP